MPFCVMDPYQVTVHVPDKGGNETVQLILIRAWIADGTPLGKASLTVFMAILAMSSLLGGWG